MKKIIVVLCLIGLIAGVCAHQNYSDQKLFQAIGGWQSKIDVAKVGGKSPAEISTNLAKYHATQASYTGTQSVFNTSTNTTQNERYIFAEVPVATYAFGPPERHLSKKMCFTFDNQNKCVNSFVHG